VKLGVAMFMTDETLAPVELGRLVEERELESIFVPEHTHIPTSRETPYPGGGTLAREYTRTIDPFVALTAIAATTSRVVVGTGICLLVQRDPIVTAKAVASLDLLSQGRVVFGVGAGWNLEEMRHHGTDPETRFALLRERIEAVRRLWSQDEASYRGDFVDFGPSWSWPKPLQTPHPPILVGGVGPRAADRALEWGDGWIPYAGGDDDGLVERIRALQQRGRDLYGRQRVPVTVLTRSPSRATLERYAEAGTERVAVWLPSAGREQVEPVLDGLAALVSAALR
jgi:probable F420-dependent oxidoreductase